MHITQEEAALEIYDFCGTLFRGNTTLLFLRYMCRNALPSRYGYRLSFYWWWMVAAVLKRFWPALAPWRYMDIRLQAFHGMTSEQIACAAESFFEQVLVPSALPPLSRFQSDLRAGRSVVVVSFTLQQILNEFSRHYNGVAVYGNRLAFRNRICNGGYAFAMQKEGKYAFLTRRFSPSILRESRYHTNDPIADSDLITHVRYPVVWP